ncbi:hypothetical protein BYT27DRAFT_7184782 [Phlegmacium glaucopus]|nr:hypothetical protein BYT27DRAFT_7184782 [Phlegmacium glaucopus]
MYKSYSTIYTESESYPETSPSHPIWMGRRGWVVEVVETVAKMLSARRCFVPPGAKKQVYDVLFVLLTVMVMCRKRELRSDEVVATS